MHIIRAFGGLGKTRHSLILAQGVENAETTRKQLMRIRLMAYIEQKLVMGTIEQTVACQRKLNHAQARSDMPAILGGGQKNLFANL